MMMAAPIRVSRCGRSPNTEAGHPDQLEIDEGGKARRRRLAVGDDQEPMPDRAEKSGGDNEDADENARRPYRLGQGRRCQGNRGGNCREEKHPFGRVGPCQIACQDDVETVADHRSEREEHGGLNPLRPGPGHDDHADKADGDRRPAPRTDPFAEHRPGETRYQKSAGEADRRRFGELQVAQCLEVEHRRQRQEEAPRQLQERPPRPVERRPAPWPEGE